MNNVFDLQRWGLLVRKHWSENRNKYTLSLIAIGALMFLWMGFLLMVESRRPLKADLQVVTFYVGLFLTGSLYASLLFSDLASRPKAINYMSVPASHLEKLLCMLLFCVCIFFVCYTAIFYLVDTIMVKVSNTLTYTRWQENQLYINGIRDPYIPEQVANVFYDNKEFASKAPFNVLLLILTIFFTVQGAYALGSIYFPTYSFIKTTIVLLLVILFFVFFIGKMLSNILPPGHFSSKFELFYLRISGYGYDYDANAIKLPTWLWGFYIYVFKYILLLVFWVAAYFRLKEKEV